MEDCLLPILPALCLRAVLGGRKTRGLPFSRVLLLFVTDHGSAGAGRAYELQLPLAQGRESLQGRDHVCLVSPRVVGQHYPPHGGRRLSAAPGGRGT